MFKVYRLPFISIVFFVAACSAIEPLGFTADKTQYSPLPSSIKYPNGVTHTPDGTLFIGSVVSGNIWRKSPDSDFELAFAETSTRFAGTALRFDPKTNYLWVASPDFLGRKVNDVTIKRPNRIAVIDTRTAVEIWSTEMPNGGFGNDFTLDGEGGVFLTDSTLDKVWHVPSVGSEFIEVASGPAMQPGSLGPAGIAFFPDGKIVTGLFSDGKILLIELDENNVAKNVRSLGLERVIENPDGLFALPNNQLLLLEGAVESGNGKLLHVDLDSPEPHKISVLADEIDSPLNLTVNDRKVLITEGRVRHLMLPDQDIATPRDFSTLEVALPTNYSAAPLLLPRGNHPESITASHRKYLYTGSAVTSEIHRTNIETGKTELFSKSGSEMLMSVQGLLADERAGILYACTANLGMHASKRQLPSRLVGFNISTGQYQGHWDLPENGFCNDISAFVDGRLLVSDTTNPRILIFDPSNDGKLSVWFRNKALGGAQFNGNGIVWDQHASAVYLTTFEKGQLLRVNLSETNIPQSVDVVQLPRALNGADALRLVGSRELVLFENGLSTGSDGQITHVNLHDDKAELLTLTNSIKSPTSGVVVDGIIYTPNSFFRSLFSEGGVTRRQSEIRRLTLQR